MASVPEAVLSEMRATNERFDLQVVQKHQLNELDRVYTADARILPPGADMIQGRDAIKQFWQQAIQSLKVKSAKLTTIDAEMLGDGVFEIGRADLTLTTARHLRSNTSCVGNRSKATGNGTSIFGTLTSKGLVDLPEGPPTPSCTLPRPLARPPSVLRSAGPLHDALHSIG